MRQTACGGCNWTITLLSVIIAAFWNSWAVFIQMWPSEQNIAGNLVSFRGSWFARIESIRAIVRKTNSDPKCGVEA
jgi:hypothetical protein